MAAWPYTYYMKARHMSNEYMLLPFTHSRYYLREQGLNECTCKILNKEKHS